MRTFLVAIMILSCCFNSDGQEDWPVLKISLPDGLYTKPYVIKRELPAGVGDTVRDWASFKEKAKRQLLNTGLFKEASFDRDPENGELIVNVTEALFILPIPFIDLADRNLNEWWVTHNHQLNRLNLGLNLYHINLTGRNDPLKLTAQWGFIQKYYASYYFPYFGKELNWQPFLEGLYANQKEIPYTTIDNKQVWYGNPSQILLERYRISAGLRYRPKWNTTFSWEMSYFQNRVGMDIQERNPLFINDASGFQRYLQSSLTFKRDFRNVWIYPTQGHRLKAELIWNGLSESLNTLLLEMKTEYWHEWTPTLSNGIRVSGRKYLYRDLLPFYQARALGYGNNYVRGYEYFVVDGSDFILLQKDMKIQLLESNWDWGSLMFIKPLRKMPLEIFTNIFVDAGRVNAWENSENNFLDEQWLVGYGAGLDVLLYRNFLFQFQYSLGVHGNRGFFIHFSNNY